MIDNAQKEAGRYVNETYPYEPGEDERLQDVRDKVWKGFVKGYRTAVAEKYEISPDDERMAKRTLEFLKGENDVPILQHDCDIMAGWLEKFVSRFIPDKDDARMRMPTSKRTRVNYAICKLQALKPLREAVVLEGYVYDGNRPYIENLLNYIKAIPDERLQEVHDYLKAHKDWPYDDDYDWK